MALRQRLSCSTVSMNLISDFFYFSSVEVAGLLWAQRTVCWAACLFVCFYARITANNFCLPDATGAAWLYPASLPKTWPAPNLISSFLFLPLCNPLTTLLCFSAHSSCMFYVSGFRSASLTHASCTTQGTLLDDILARDSSLHVLNELEMLT